MSEILINCECETGGGYKISGGSSRGVTVEGEVHQSHSSPDSNYSYDYGLGGHMSTNGESGAQVEASVTRTSPDSGSSCSAGVYGSIDNNGNSSCGVSGTVIY